MNFDGAVSDSISIARATAARREDYQRAACVLAAEVERLRAELAAAKAASVVPEESVIWLLAAAAKLEKDGESSGFDSMTKAANWLRERLKERGEG